MLWETYLIRQTKGLRSDGMALCEQITTIDKRQCLKYLGRLDRAETDAIRAAADCAIGGDIPEEMEAPWKKWGQKHDSKYRRWKHGRKPMLSHIINRIAGSNNSAHLKDYRI